MSPLSNDPAKRATQLANLRPGAGGGDGGLQRAVRHGAYAAVTEAEMEAKVLELVEAIGEDLPVREVDGGVPAADAIPLRLLAETLIRRERVRETELRRGIETDDGRLRGVVEYGLRLDGQAIKLCEQLGLTPVARARLGVDLVRAQAGARSLSDELDSARRAREQRETSATIEGTAADDPESSGA